VVSPARRAAFEVLLAVDRGGFASDLLESATRGMAARDAALATSIVFGVLRRRLQLRWLVDAVSSRPAASLDPAVRTAAEMGAYQLRFLERIPPHAAVAESVDLVKRANKRSAAGLVNAVLRRLPPLPEEWPDAPTRFSMPAWILDRWTRRYGAETARAIAAAALDEPIRYARVRPGLAVPEGLEPTDLAGCYAIRGPVPPGAWLQDIGSQSLIPLLDLQPGHTFLDVCAAPGNKTAQALETPLALAVACDASLKRLRELRAPAPRVAADATWPLPFGRVFERILVDAPCSGTGTLARNPEIRWRLVESDLARHAARQEAILVNALACLKPGGRLLYATCSLEPEENEQVLKRAAPGRVQSVVERLPGRDPGDGFFAAVLT
jgi:16S rRNA (cytosine967-C5)-methyltransferase